MCPLEAASRATKKEIACSVRAIERGGNNRFMSSGSRTVTGKKESKGRKIVSARGPLRADKEIHADNGERVGPRRKAYGSNTSVGKERIGTGDHVRGPP